MNNLICLHLNILFIDWFLLHWCSPSVGSRSYNRTLVDMFNILCRNRSQLTNWNLIPSSSWSKLPDRRYTCPQVSPRHICIIIKNKNKNYYYYFPILPKFTIRNVNRICLYTEPQGGRRTRDSVICCEASFAVQHTYIADLLGRCNMLL
jgi:hypothetical protein